MPLRALARPVTPDEPPAAAPQAAVSPIAAIVDGVRKGGTQLEAELRSGELHGQREAVHQRILDNMRSMPDWQNDHGTREMIAERAAIESRFPEMRAELAPLREKHAANVRKALAPLTRQMAEEMLAAVAAFAETERRFDELVKALRAARDPRAQRMYIRAPEQLATLARLLLRDDL